MELFGDYSVISLIKVISEIQFFAKTSYDEKKKMLIVSFQVENGEKVNLKFYESLDGHPVLILNMPETFPGGKADRFYSLLAFFLQWQYKEKMPKPKEYNFKSHHFYDWQPNDSHSINVYLWNKEGMNQAKINNLILGR